ncbi:MAG: bifunctional diguanylate cyclase/phosphodiesterase [Egicoccus sp.]
MRDRTQGPHFAPVRERTPFAAWWWSVVLLAAVCSATILHRPDGVQLPNAGVAFWLLVVFVVLGELRPVVASGRIDPEGVSLSTAFLFAILLRWGPELAVSVVVFSSVAGELVRRKRAFAAAFNIAQYVVSYALAWWVLQSVFGWEVTANAPASLTPVDLFAVVAAGATYHVSNLLIVGIAVGAIERRRLRSTVFENVRYYTMTTGAVLALSPLVLIVADSHWAFLPLLLLPLFLLWKTAAMSLEREEHALHDGLTGLANRLSLAEQVARHLAAGRPGAICLLDLDRFKDVNDTLGHAVGDELLQMVGDRLRAGVRDTDVASRIGGDEFVLLLDVADEAAARDVVDRLAADLLEPYELGGVRLEVEVSIGVALFPEHGNDLEVLQRRADAAMYAAKAAGELVVLFSDSLLHTAPSRLSLLAELRRAIGRGELEVHYQPKVAVNGRHTVGLEALVRWRHPERGLLQPGEFLPVAERTAVMRSVTASVLDLVLRQLRAWDVAGIAVPVAINTSLHDLSDPGFAATIRSGLSEHGLDPSLLVIEITEEALRGDPTRALQTLDELQAVGIELSLDDFGTGYASLGRLKRLPVSEVKIDRSFVMHLDADPDGRDAAIIRSVVQLADGLGLRCVAEGVETEAAMAILAELDCEVAQGYLVSRPIPAAEATAWLLEEAVPAVGALVADR